MSPFSVSFGSLLVRAALIGSLVTSPSLAFSEVMTMPPAAAKPLAAPGAGAPDVGAPRSPVAAPQHKYCATNDKGGVSVIRALLKVPAKLEDDFKAWSEDLGAAYKAVSQMREQLLIEGGLAQSLAALVSQTQPKVMSLKERLFSMLAQLPASYRGNGQLALAGYFKLVAALVEIEIHSTPRSLGLENLRSKYAIDLPPVALERYFQDATFHIDQVEIEPVTRQGKMGYRLALTAESVFFAMTRAAARSPDLKKPNESYLETVRCVLGRAVLSKLTLNKSLINQQESKFNLDPEQSFCLGSKARDFQMMSNREAEVGRELSLRANFLNHIPAAAANLDDGAKMFIVSSGIGNQLSNLFAFPELLPLVNSDAKSPISSDTFNRVRNSISNTIDAQFKKFPGLEALRGVWESPRVQTQITDIMNDCHVTLGDKDDKRTITHYESNLNYGDDFEFAMNLYSGLQRFPGRWVEMDKAQLTLAIRNYVITTKVTAALKSIEFLIGFRADSESADVDEIMAAAAADLSKTLHEEYDRIWAANPGLQKWLEDTATAIFAEKDKTRTNEAQLLAFTQDLMDHAVIIKEIMDPKKSPGLLPYNEDQVLQALASAVKSLSPENRRRYNLLLEQKSHKHRVNLWKDIQGLMETEAKAIGATCGEGTKLERLKYVGGGWINNKMTQEQRAASVDCVNFAVVAGAIGADSPQKPSDLAHTIAYLQTQLSESEVRDFIAAYRKYLVEEITMDYRLLALPIKKIQTTFEKIYSKLPFTDGSEELLWQRLAEGRDAKAFVPLVTEGLKESIASLEGYLKIITEAKSETDLDFFIKRTKVINTILGEGTMSDVISKLNASAKPKFSAVLSNSEVGFFFPSLLRYHQKLQSKWIAEEDLNHDVWGEFVKANTQIVFAVVGGWVLKHTFGVLPKFTGGPALGSLINRAGSRMQPLIAAHADFTLMVLAGYTAHTHMFKAAQVKEQDLIAKLARTDGAFALEQGAAIPMISNNMFLLQKEYFANEIATSTSQLRQLYAWMALPFLIGHGAPLFSKFMGGRRMKRDAALPNKGYEGRLKFETDSRRGIEQSLRLLGNDLKVLGNPKSVDFATLRASLEAAKIKATSKAQIARAEEAYERIITTLGSKIERFMINNPNQKQSYANAMFGNGASTRQLDDIFNEYLRIYKAGGK